MGKMCDIDGRLCRKIKKNKLLSVLEVLLPKDSPYLLNDPRISLIEHIYEGMLCINENRDFSCIGLHV